MNKAFLLIDECHYYFKFSIALLKSANSCNVSVSPRRLGSMSASANERVNQSLVASSFQKECSKLFHSVLRRN